MRDRSGWGEAGLTHGLTGSAMITADITSCGCWLMECSTLPTLLVIKSRAATRYAGAGQVVVGVITADDADEGPGVLLARADLARCPLASLSRPLATAGDRCSTQSK